MTLPSGDDPQDPAVDRHRVVLGKTRLMVAQAIDLGALGARQEQLAADGRTSVLAAVDGRAVAAIGIADAAGIAAQLSPAC